jgi:Bacterial Ig-like domain (group 2)
MRLDLRLFRLFTAVALAMGLAACEPGTATAPKQPSVVAIAALPASFTLPVGHTQALTVQGQLSDATKAPIDVTAAASFSSQDARVATVDSRGIVTAMHSGSTQIHILHSQSGQQTTATVTVPAGALAGIVLSPSQIAVAPGGTAALSVTAIYADTSQSTLLSGVTFASADTAVATVDAQGVITGLHTGTTSITATDTASGRTAVAAVTVGASYTVLSFNDPSQAYALTPFGGESASLVSAGIPPGGPSGAVVMITKPAGAPCWAGTTLSVGGQLSIGRLPFSALATVMTVQFYAPAAGLTVKLKAENAGNAGVSVETDVVTTSAGWQVLTFDFSHPSPGTAALDPAQTYNKISIFSDFTCSSGGASPAADEVFYVGPVAFVGAAAPSAPPLPVPLPSYAVLDFNAANVTVTATPFGGASAVLTSAAVPAGGPSGTVLALTKTAGAQCYAGATLSVGYNYSIGAVPFANGATRITVPVFVPNAGVDVKLKVEDANNAAVSVETDVIAASAGWQTLTFDFANQAPGTAALDLSKTYDKLSIFADFTCANGAPAPATDESFYVGAFTSVGAPAPAAPPLSPPVITSTYQTVTFDDATKTYPTSDFAGDVSSVGAGPAGSNGNVLKIIKSANSALYAGTLVGDSGIPAAPTVGAIPFTNTRTTFTVRVWAAQAGLDVKLKFQDASAAHTVETDALTTVAGGWSTLTFNLANPAPGTPALDPAQTYVTMVVFPDFGSTPNADEPAMYFDDFTFLP